MGMCKLLSGECGILEVDYYFFSTLNCCGGVYAPFLNCLKQVRFQNYVLTPNASKSLNLYTLYYYAVVYSTHWYGNNIWDRDILLVLPNN